MAEPRRVRKGAGDISETPSPEHLHQQQLVRTLGLVDVVMIGIAGMIGGAIFVLVGPAIGLAGQRCNYCEVFLTPFKNRIHLLLKVILEKGGGLPQLD